MIANNSSEKRLDTTNCTTPDTVSGADVSCANAVTSKPSDAGAKSNQTPASTKRLGLAVASALYFGTKLSCQTSWFSRSDRGTYGSSSGMGLQSDNELRSMEAQEVHASIVRWTLSALRWADLGSEKTRFSR